MRMRIAFLTALLSIALALHGCAGRELQEGQRRYETFTGTSFTSDGTNFQWIVETRAARIAGPAEFLPLQLMIRNKDKADLTVPREGFVLERDDGTKLPLVSYREFEKGYPRHRVDLRTGVSFLESLNGRFPDPPFQHRSLDFYPLRESGTVPREEIVLRTGQIAIGFLYFRMPDPEELTRPGNYKVLFTPGGTEERYVLEVQAYKPAKSAA